MELVSENKVISTNVSNAKAFEIDGNSKMFEILSSKIYNDKISAVLRELSSNAYDSHIAANKTELPFKVVLPSELFQYLEIEDFGVGLSEDEVLNVYTKYGASTKSSSNEMVGAFGLGSKTPFAYTTSFMIRSRKDGIECLYNAYIDSNGPSISKIGEKKTDECNGVLIKIPAKEFDVDEFTNKAQKILSTYPTRPNVVGGRNFEFDFAEEECEKFNSDGFLFRREEGYQKNIILVMGNVSYRVDTLYYSKNHLEKFDFLIDGYTIFLKVPIGSFQVTASRESIDYQHFKMEKYLKEIDKNALKYKKEIQKELDKINSSVEAYIYMWDNALHPKEFTYGKNKMSTPKSSKLYNMVGVISVDDSYKTTGNVIPFGGIVEEKFHILDVCDSKKGYKSYIKNNLNSKRYVIVIDSSKMSELRLKRVLSVLHAEKESIIKYEYIKKESSEERTQNNYEDTEVFGFRTVVKGKLLFDGVSTMNLTENTDKKYFRILEEDENRTFRTVEIYNYLSGVEEEFVFIRDTKRTHRKLNLQNIPEAKDYFQNKINNKNDYIETLAAILVLEDWGTTYYYNRSNEKNVFKNVYEFYKKSYDLDWVDRYAKLAPPVFATNSIRHLFKVADKEKEYDEIMDKVITEARKDFPIAFDSYFENLEESNRKYILKLVQNEKEIQDESTN